MESIIAMTDRSTLKDIAQKAGVGVATVDRVLNGRAPVKAATATRVLEAAEALNYHAHRLMRRRIEEMAPAKTLGFILQKRGKWFYQSLADNLRKAAADLREIRSSVEIDFVESLSPDDLAGALADMRERADAVAVVAVDHPKVAVAATQSAEADVPVFALLSQLDTPDLAGFVGIDGRKAGRTAGWAMTRFARGGGEVGILIGSHRYRTQEDRESGFRSYLREYAADIRLRDSVVYMDDTVLAYEAAAEMLSATPGLSGIYHCGGGVEGVVRALEEAGRGADIFYICHEKSPFAVDGLLSGTVDLVIANPIEAIARTVVGSMAQVLTGKQPDAMESVIPFELVTAENI